jgi:DNA-directed RNA polymerase specialized sigma24 family protein
MSRAGFGPSRIAELLDTTANTVNVTLQRAKKTGKLKRQES